MKSPARIAPSAAPSESNYTEQLNFKTSLRVKERLVAQADRLDITQTAMARVCLALGLEAVELMEARMTEGGA